MEQHELYEALHSDRSDVLGSQLETAWNQEVKKSKNGQINIQTPTEDRKPTSVEVKRYSVFLKEHISIINPKIVILMGSSAMEAVTGINTKISSERGKWKEIMARGRMEGTRVFFLLSWFPAKTNPCQKYWRECK